MNARRETRHCGGKSGASSDFLILMCMEGGFHSLQLRAFLKCGSGKNVLEVQLIQHGSLAKLMYAPVYETLFPGIFFSPLVSEIIDAILRLSKRSAAADISSVMIKRCAHQRRCVCIKLCA